MSDRAIQIKMSMEDYRELTNELNRLRSRVTELLEANKREVERRRTAEAAAMRQPTTPAEFRDLLVAIMAEHDRTTCSPQATHLGNVISSALHLAAIATPGDANGPSMEEFYRHNRYLMVGMAKDCRKMHETEVTQ